MDVGVKLHPLKQNSAAASSKAMIRFKWGTSSDFILKIIAQFFRENNLWFVKMVDRGEMAASGFCSPGSGRKRIPGLQNQDWNDIIKSLPL